MTDEERSQVLDRLRSSRQKVLDAVAGVPEEQWIFQPDAGVWSMAHCAEHIVHVETVVLERLQEQIRTDSPAPERRGETAGKERYILKAVPNRGVRVKAPDGAEGTGRRLSRDAFLELFEQVRAGAIEFAATTTADLRSYFSPHFVLGLLDGYQWLLMISLHAERHVAQIEELRADPRFPAG